MKEDRRIHISLDADQYRDLLNVLDIGLLIYETMHAVQAGEAASAGDGGGHITLKDLAALERVVLESAIGTDAEDFVQETGKRLLPADDIMDETEEIVDAYIEDQFWLELSDRLGQRDFLENISEEEIGSMEAGDGLLPDGVREYYGKYDKELDRHGIDRLRVEGR